MNNLAQDLPLGKSGEDFVLQIVQRKYPKAHRIEGNFKPYDILVPETDTKIEVKTDRKSQETKNVAIEVECYGKPSGLTSTEADFWAFIYWFHPKEAWYMKMVPTWKLKRDVFNDKKWFVMGGDHRASKMYLMKNFMLYNYCHDGEKNIPISKELSELLNNGGVV